MKARFAPDPTDTLYGSFSLAWDDPNSSFFLPAVDHNGGSRSATVPPIVLTPALSSEAVAAEGAQNGLGSVVAVTSAGGITFNLLFDAAAMAAPASFRTGMEQAAALLGAAIFDKITVNIKIDYSGTGGGAAAGPDAGLYESYSSIRTDLIKDATLGDTTFNALPSGTSIQGQSSVAVWNAQLKVLGLLGANDTTTDDGSATFATDINPNLLVGIALHELTHALGRVPYGSQPDIFDLFRFTSAGTRLFTDSIPSSAAYFSVDGGNTKLADYGRTSDPSDFLNPPNSNLTPNDAFNEFYNNNTLQQLTAADLKQLDALGFHVAAPDTQPPALVNDNSLSILAGTTQTITSGLLSATDNVSSGAQLHFTVTTAPTDGTLLLNGSATSSFTQADINNGLVSYHETATDVTSDSFLFTVTDAAGNVTGTDTFQINVEPVFSGDRTDYSMTYNSATQMLTVTDLRQGSPDGTHNLNHVAQFEFTDGVSTYAFNTAGALVSESFNNTNGTHWVNTFDVAGNQTWAWEINTYAANGSLTSQAGLNHDGTHFLTLYDVNNQYSWTTATINFDANWNWTSVTGTNVDGSHSVTPQDVAAGFDTATWYATPFDTISNSAPVSSVAAASQNVAHTSNPGIDMATGASTADGFVFNFASANSASAPVADFADVTNQISASELGRAPAASGAPMATATTAHAGSDGYPAYDNAHTVGWDNHGSDAGALGRLSAFHTSEFLLA